MSENTSVDLSGFGLWSIFGMVTAIWSVLNHDTLFGYVYGLEHPLSELAIWMAWTAVIVGAIELVLLAILLIATVLGLFWILAGLTS